MTSHIKTNSSKRFLTIALLTSPFFLAGCGGSSSSSPESSSQSQTQSISGTASTGKAIGNASVSARCEDGSGFTESVVTDSNGQFRGEVEESALPCALSVQNSDGLSFHSLATSAGISNITLLTDLAIALSGENPDQWFAQGNLALAEDVISSRAQELVNALRDLGYNVPEDLGPIQSGFLAGDLHDQLMDKLGVAINESTVLEDYQQLVLLLRDGNLSQLPEAPDTGSEPLPDSQPTTQNLSACYNPELFLDGAKLVTKTRIQIPRTETYTETKTQRILGPINFNGRSVQAREIQQTSVNGSLIRTTYYTMDSDSGATSTYGATFNISGHVTEQIYQPSLDTVEDIGLNETYRHSYTIETSGSKSDISFEHTFLGIETIQVPAGAIEACKVHFLTVVDGESSESVGWWSVGTGISLRTFSPDESNPTTIMELQSATLNGQTIH